MSALRLAALLLGAAAPARAQSAPPAPRVLSVTATSAGLRAPDSFAAGPVTLALVNRATIATEAQLVTVPAGHTSEEAVGLLRGGQPWPTWLAPAGGVGPLAPGARAAVTQTLPPGDYLLLSKLPDAAHVPQYRHGFLTAIRVAGEVKQARVDSVVAELSVGASFRFQRVETLGGRRIMLSGRERGTPIAPGARTIEVSTGTPGIHEIALVRMDSLVLLRHYAGWLERGQQGTAPGRPSGGAALTPAGTRLWLRVTLEPGTYWLLCSAAHASGRRGYETGEYAQFVVR